MAVWPTDQQLVFLEPHCCSGKNGISHLLSTPAVCCPHGCRNEACPACTATWWPFNRLTHYSQMNDLSKLPDLFILYSSFSSVLCSLWVRLHPFLLTQLFSPSLSFFPRQTIWRMVPVTASALHLPCCCICFSVFSYDKLKFYKFFLILSVFHFMYTQAACYVFGYLLCIFFFLHVLSFSMCSSASCIEMRWAFCLLLCSLSICFAVMHSIDSQNSLAGTVCSVGVCICIFIFGVEVRSCSALSVREWNCWCIRERVTRGKS